MPRPHGKQCSEWWGSTAPASLVSNSANRWVGNRFQFLATGRLMGIRYYSPVEFISHWGWVSEENNSDLLRLVEFFDQNVTSAGWRNAWFRHSLRIDTSDKYRVAVAFPSSNYYRTVVSGAANHGNISLQSGFTTTVWDFSATTLTDAGAHEGVDVLFLDD
jgi:hypothetical protein